MLTDPQILCVLSDVLAKEYGDAVFEVGQHALQATVHLRLKGSIEQLPAQEYTPTADIPLLNVLAIVAQKLGVKAEGLYALILDAAMEARAKEESVGAYLEFSNRALSEAKRKLREGLEPKTRKGVLKRIVTLSDVDIDGSSFSTAGARPAKRRRSA